MKLAWICYDEADEVKPQIWFVEPDHYLFCKVVPIVFAEIEE